MKVRLLIISVFLIPTLVSGQDRVTGRDFATRSEVIARNGMAATSQPLATQAALDILKNGGNAIDAAIAANASAGSAEPTGNGIGGDLFAIVWECRQRKSLRSQCKWKITTFALTLQYFKEKGLESNTLHRSAAGFGSGVRGWLV